jgi:outer membrane protein assembly factor BamB
MTSVSPNPLSWSSVSGLVLPHSMYRLIGLFAAVLVIGGCGLFGGDEVEDPPAELVKFKATLKIRKAWSSGVGDGAEYLRLALTPASDGSRLYVGDHDGQASAFDAIDGDRIWRTKTKLPLSAGPAVNSAVAVFGSSNGDVIALDVADGQELWRTSVSSEVLASPVVTSSLALVRTVDGKLVALSLEDGSEIWFVQQSVPRLSVRGTGAPVVNDRVVICGFDNGKLAAYELGDGSLIWDLMLSPPSGRTEVDRLSDLNSTIRIIGEDIYVVGYQSSLSAVALESGQVLWSRDISSHAGIGIDFNNLYVSGAAGELYAVARRTGRELWRKDILLNRDVTGPTAFRSSIVVGDFDGYLHWFNATTGELEARVRAGSDRVAAPPLVVNEMLYVLTDGGKLFAFKDVTPKPKS